MEPRTSAILVFVGFFVTFVLFLTCFGADFWVDNSILNSGIWKSCLKATGDCVDNVAAMKLLGKAGIAQAIQAMMCIALIVALAAGVANIVWIMEPETPKIGIVTCVCIMVAGGFTGIAVALYSMLYSGSINVLALVTGGGGGAGTPTGWAYYVAIACTTIFQILGMLCCCCACNGSNRGQVGPHQYRGNPGPYNNGRYHNNRRGMPPQNIDRGMYPPKNRAPSRNLSSHDSMYDGGYDYPVPMDPAPPPPYAPQSAPPPYGE